MKLLHSYDFKEKNDAWSVPKHTTAPSVAVCEKGIQVDAQKRSQFTGEGVHTRNGDAIELIFSLPESAEERGTLLFGFFAPGKEFAIISLNFNNKTAELLTGDWRYNQPFGVANFELEDKEKHILRLEKGEGRGKLVKLANLDVFLDGNRVFSLKDLNLLPEMGVMAGVENGKLIFKEFNHYGNPLPYPEYMRVGGLTCLSEKDIKKNLGSICRGISDAAEKGIRLLLVAETGLSGLYPMHPVTFDKKGISEGERLLTEYISKTPNAPYTIVGLPIWEQGPFGKQIRYNAMRVYAPDGSVLETCRKIHSCEYEFQSGLRLNEFEIDGLPISLHVCHDQRYPELATLPVMFGARLVLHPKGTADINDLPNPNTADYYHGWSEETANYLNAFYLETGGVGHISGPRGGGTVLCVSENAEKDNGRAPFIGKTCYNVFYSDIRLHDAFGYWPMRSFRASEEVAAAYLNLYRAMGGKRI